MVLEKKCPGYSASPVERHVLRKGVQTEKIPGVGDQKHRGVETKLGIFLFVEWDSQEGVLVEEEGVSFKFLRRGES